MVAFLADILGAQACLKLWSAKPNPPGTGGREKKNQQGQTFDVFQPPMPSWLSYQLGYPLIKKSLIKKCPRKDLKIATGTHDMFRWFEIDDNIKNTHKSSIGSLVSCWRSTKAIPSNKTPPITPSDWSLQILFHSAKSPFDSHSQSTAFLYRYRRTIDLKCHWTLKSVPWALRTATY